MSATDQLSRVTPYLERLLSDEYIHEQLGDAVTRMQHSRRRAKGQTATEALKDRKLRNQLGAAAGSLTAAARALTNPEPPKRHWLRRTLLVIAAGVGVTVAWQQTTKTPTH